MKNLSEKSRLRFVIVLYWTFGIYLLWGLGAFTPFTMAILPFTIFVLGVWGIHFVQFWETLTFANDAGSKSEQKIKYAAKFGEAYLIEHRTFFEDPYVADVAFVEYKDVEYTVMHIHSDQLPASFTEDEIVEIEKVLGQPLEKVTFYDFCNQKLATL